MKLTLSTKGILLDNGGKVISWTLADQEPETLVDTLQDVLTEARKALGIDQAAPVPWMPARPVQTASGVREPDEGDLAEMRLQNGGAALRHGVGEMDIPVIDEGNMAMPDWSA